MRPFKLNLLVGGLLLMLGAAFGASTRNLPETSSRTHGVDVDLREGSWWRDPSWAMSAGELGARWIRLRGIPPASDTSEIVQGRAVLNALRQRGVKACVILRWKNWNQDLDQKGAGSVRPHLPTNLQEAFERARMTAAAFGDLVDAWEIDNEPDLGFVPEAAEAYVAYIKAVYLGLSAGTEKRGVGENSQVSPSVIMGALGLPPGPWLERFAANDGFAYTDGFNYHYYGYAEDFSAVYRVHETAAVELNAGSKEQRADSLKLIAKNYPIFLTEIGYGMLGKRAMSTKEGRLRQWRWFKAVGEQVGNLRIEAPMAFVLQPYLEYSSTEFGLTVPTVQSAGNRGEKGTLGTETFWSGGVQYQPSDFGAVRSEPWMDMIGKQIGGSEATPALAGWLAVRGAVDKSEVRRVVPRVPVDPDRLVTNRATSSGVGSISWTMTVPSPSPVVIDFINGEGMSFIKRYNGSFVTGLQPATAGKPEAKKIKPQALETKSATPSPRSEEFMIHVRTQNGNLYEVYPTRQATPEWQTYLEPRDNFTMSFYGRAELPWRFKDNKPASLVVVMYPKLLPATYEFRRPRLVRLSEPQKPETGNLKPEVFRFGQGKVILYNFSDKPVAGRLLLPETVGHVAPNAQGSDELIVLQPGERRVISVSVKGPWGKYERLEAPISFVPDDKAIPPARFLTAFLPDIGGLNQTVEAKMLLPEVQTVEPGSNRSFLLSRPRATEEAPMLELGHVLAQEGAAVERTKDGFNVTVTGLPPGKEQRVEVEIPWPDGRGFKDKEFLSLEYRLGGSR